MRGVPADYNGWSDMGNDGWSFDELRDCFVKLEHNERFAQESNPLHNSQGLNIKFINVIMCVCVSLVGVHKVVMWSFPGGKEVYNQIEKKSCKNSKKKVVRIQKKKLLVKKKKNQGAIHVEMPKFLYGLDGKNSFFFFVTFCSVASYMLLLCVYLSPGMRCVCVIAWSSIDFFF